MKLASGVAMLVVLWSYRLARCAMALAGLATLTGFGWALLLVILAAAARFTLLLRIAAGLTLVLLWHWPWWAALIGVVPRLVLVLPGYIRTLGARWRHPRPLWPAPAAARVAATVPARPPAEQGL